MSPVTLLPPFGAPRTRRLAARIPSRIHTSLAQEDEPMKRASFTAGAFACILVLATLSATGCSKTAERISGVEQQQLTPDREPAPLAPYPGNQVVDLTLTNRSPYTVEAWIGGGLHRVIAPNETAHVLTLMRDGTVASARYLNYTARTTIHPRGVNPIRAVASATVTRTGYGIIAIQQN